MSFFERLKGVALALIILILLAPISVFLTLLLSHFWGWFEDYSGIEAYGHSGPAEWCYLFDYGVSVVAASLYWRAMQRNR